MGKPQVPPLRCGRDDIGEGGAFRVIVAGHDRSGHPDLRDDNRVQGTKLRSPLLSYTGCALAAAVYFERAVAAFNGVVW